MVLMKVLELPEQAAAKLQEAADCLGVSAEQLLILRLAEQF
jgi:hypothetical protein